MEGQSLRKGEVLIPTPKGFIGLRVAQIVVSLIVLGLAGYWIHGYNAGPLDFAITSSIFTWIVALYAILTEHVPSCRQGYNTWAVLSLDFLMIIFWLASLGSNASLRSTFTETVRASCYNDGSLVNSGHCSVYKRGAVASDAGLAILSAVAGISAIMLLLFIPTFAYVTHFFRLEWAKQSPSGDAEKTAAAPAAAAQSQPFINQQQQPQAQWAQQQPQQQQQQYQPAYAPQQTTYDPYAQQHTAYNGAQGHYTGSPAPQYNQQYQPPQ